MILSSFVLFEIESLKKMTTYLLEARKILQKNGIFIAITGSEHLYNKKWLSWNTNFSCNKNLKSGDRAKVFLKKEKIEFTDIYWTENDYLECFQKAGFNILQTHYPLGKISEKFPWKDELKYSPFIIFIAKNRSFD